MDENNEKLKDLCELVGRVKDVILQPLQCLEGGMPSEIFDVISTLQSYALTFNFGSEEIF